MDTKWKTLLAVIIGIILLFILPTLIGSMFAVILATIYVGFAIGGNYRNGAFYGAIVGVILAIISWIVTDYVFNGFIGGSADTLVLVLLTLAIYYGICGVIGGIIGIFIKRRITSTKSSDGSKGYLVCAECGGYYELQPGESPEDYEECECGGKLNYSTLLLPHNGSEDLNSDKSNITDNKMNINWKTVLIGLLILYITNSIMSIVLYGVAVVVALILTTIYVGYTVGGNYRNVAFIGAIIGVIIAIILSIITNYVSGVPISAFINMLIPILLNNIILYAVIGAFGGIIGIFIKGKRKNKENTNRSKGYLVCDKCGGYYELQPGESPEDYEQCECSGKLKYSTLLSSNELKDSSSDKSEIVGENNKFRSFINFKNNKFLIILIILALIITIIPILYSASIHGKETVIFDKNIGDNTTMNVHYVKVPSNVTSIKVEIFNSTSFRNGSTINLYSLNVTGQNGQSIGNYIPNLKGELSFNITNGYSGNNSFNYFKYPNEPNQSPYLNIKSIAIITNAAKANIKITTIS
jgi:hypothetical protein